MCVDVTHGIKVSNNIDDNALKRKLLEDLNSGGKNSSYPEHKIFEISCLRREIQDHWGKAAVDLWWDGNQLKGKGLEQPLPNKGKAQVKSNNIILLCNMIQLSQMKTENAGFLKPRSIPMSFWMSRKCYKKTYKFLSLHIKPVGLQRIFFLTEYKKKTYLPTLRLFKKFLSVFYN